MAWYNDANFRSKGGDRLNTMVTSKNVNFGVSWRLIVGVEGHSSESMSSKQSAAGLIDLIFQGSV